MISMSQVKILKRIPDSAGKTHRQPKFIQNYGAQQSIQDSDKKRSHSPEKNLIHEYSPLSIQPKLTVSKPDDPYEREADRVAEQVMRMPDPVVMRKSTCPFRTSTGCMDEDDNEKGLIQRKVAAHSGPTSEVPPVVHDVLQSPGKSLNADTRAFFEPRFGHDFSDVRIFSDNTAAYAASLLQARAMTVGGNILFGAGQFSPETSKGQRLIAHELVHIVQKNHSPSRMSKVSRDRTGYGSNPKHRFRESAKEERPVIKQQRSSAGIHRVINADPNVDLTLSFNIHGINHGFTRVGSQWSAQKSQSTSDPLDKEIVQTMLQSSRVFSLHGSNTADVSTSLEKHIAAREQVVNLARTARFGFGAGKNARMSPQYWEQSITGRWDVKPGVDRMTALKDLYVNPGSYFISCKQARDFIMEIGGGGMGGLIDEDATMLDTIPGEAGYIEKQVSIHKKGYEGENVIYMGNDLWWGHLNPPAQYNLCKWVDIVDKFPPVFGGAVVSKKRTRPTEGLK